MITHVYRIYLLYFPERKTIFVNELMSLERKVFQYTIVNKKQFSIKKNGQHDSLEFLKIWSIYFGVFEKFYEHIWGLRKWHDMVTPVIKVNESPPLGFPIG